MPDYAAQILIKIPSVVYARQRVNIYLIGLCFEASNVRFQMPYIVQIIHIIQ